MLDSSRSAPKDKSHGCSSQDKLIGTNRSQKELAFRPKVSRRHLERLTARWSEIDADCWLEVVHIREGEGPFAFHVLVPDDEEGWHAAVDEALEAVEAGQADGHPTYVCPNPVNGQAIAEREVGSRARAYEVVACLFVFADADDGDASERVAEDGSYSWQVVTGVEEDGRERTHSYWELDEPVKPEVWKPLQAGLIDTLGTDRAVRDPSRLMRLAGTLTHPSADKRAKGRVNEVVRLHKERGRPRTPEWIAKRFPQHVEEERPETARQRRGDADGFEWPEDTADVLLAACDPDCGRDEWLSILDAYKSSGGSMSTGEAWSRGSSKFEVRDFERAWRGAKGECSMGTLFHHSGIVAREMARQVVTERRKAEREEQAAYAEEQRKKFDVFKMRRAMSRGMRGNKINKAGV